MENAAYSKSSSKDKLIVIGRVLKTKGVEGRLRVLPLTFNPDRFLSLKDVFFEKSGRRFKKTIENVDILGKYVFLKMQGIDSPEKARTFTGYEIKIPASKSPELPEGVYYHYQIIGLDVFTDSGRYIGRVKEIMETGSNDVYSVMDNEKEVLVPAIEEVVKEINPEENRIVIHPIKGLLDDI